MAESFTLDLLDAAMAAARAGSHIHPLMENGRAVYLMTISPKMRATLVMVAAKARWKEQYRADRIARRALHG